MITDAVYSATLEFFYLNPNQTDRTMKPIELEQLEELLPEPGEFNLMQPPEGWRWHDTESHGYLMPPITAVNNIPDWMNSTDFSPRGKYEEDCDWCLPVIANLGMFNRKVQIIAIETFYNWHPYWFIRKYNRVPVDSHKFRQTRQSQIKSA